MRLRELIKENDDDEGLFTGIIADIKYVETKDLNSREDMSDQWSNVRGWQKDNPGQSIEDWATWWLSMHRYSPIPIKWVGDTYRLDVWDGHHRLLATQILKLPARVIVTANRVPLENIKAFKDGYKDIGFNIKTGKSSNKLAEDDAEHRQSLQQTGFWGKQAAGCIFLALDTGKVCIAHRSYDVEQPGTWGTWGGAIDENEDPAAAVRREVEEEAGYHGEMKLIPLYVFSHTSGFKYYNFLAVVPHEFKPILNWETQGSAWVTVGDWPNPLHPGLAKLLSDTKSVNLIQHYVDAVISI